MKTIKAVCFSPTGTTRKAVCHIAAKMAESLRIPCETVDFTLPSNREQALVFTKNDFVILGVPVYAGRVPNVLLKFLQTMRGVGALGVPIVVFGNRDFDDALVELRDLMENAGIRTLAAAAFVGEHAFSHVLGANRPDDKDLLLAEKFADSVAEKTRMLLQNDLPKAPVTVDGTPFPYRGYYRPRDRHGNAIDILKVKPLVDERCNNCKECVRICPMGSIDGEDVRLYKGICIKCGACVKGCARQARYYEDNGYLYHQHELEEIYTRRAEPKMFL